MSKPARQRRLPKALLPVILCLLFGSRLCPAATTDEVGRILSEVERNLLLQSDPVLHRLVKYREIVEQGAYLQTLRLCSAYRQGRGLPTPSHPGRSQYSYQDSLAAWSEIALAGALQPIDAIFGPKADYIEVNRLKLWALQSWFQSVYTVYLIDSPGFLQAAVHCLNSLDAREINLFASTIVATDYVANVASEGAATYVLGASVIGSVISKATSFVISSARHLLRQVRAKLIRSPFIFGSAIVVPIGVDNLFTYLNKVEEAKAVTLDFLDPSSETRKNGLLSSRILMMSLAVQKFAAETESGDPRFPEFIAWTKAHITKHLRSQAHRDLQRIKATPDRSLNENGAEKKYKVVLEAILPILDQIDLPN
ncbi:MAG: hypothetical protein AB7G93_12730 [Bdellovibrionales bacterium]